MTDRASVSTFSKSSSAPLGMGLLRCLTIGMIAGAWRQVQSARSLKAPELGALLTSGAWVRSSLSAEPLAPFFALSHAMSGRLRRR
jgi:hypothetical protein